MKNLEKVVLSTSLGFLSTTAFSSVANAEMLKNNLSEELNQTKLTNPDGSFDLAAIWNIQEYYQTYKPRIDGLTDSEWCIARGYDQSSCSGEDCVEEYCPKDSSYIKCACYCNGQNTCKEMGYVTSCSAGYTADTSDRCMIDSSMFKCKPNPCTGYYTSCSSGYTLNTSDSCLSGSTTKYKCVASPCTGYDYTSCPSGYVSGGTCLSGSTTKYKCVVNPCTGYNYTSCPLGYVSGGTCLSGSTTKHKCVANPCTGYNYTSCPTGYVSAGTCLSGTTTKHKCTITNAQKCKDAGYTKTSCSTGYVLTTKCPYDGAYYKTCNITTTKQCTDAGYTKTSCSSGYVLTTQCPYNGAYYKTCNITPAKQCTDAGYVSGKTCDGSHSTHQKRSSCPYVSTYYKCVAMTTKEACNTDGFYKTSCSTGYNLSGKCSHGNYYLTCEKSNATKCTEAGYSTSITGSADCSSSESTEKYEACSFDSAYGKCVSKTNAEICLDTGYTLGSKTCTGSHPTHQYEQNCYWDSNYKKCAAMSAYQMCQTDGYTQTTCSNGVDAYCPHSSTYKKCSSTTDYAQMCIDMGYGLTSCPSGYELTGQCPDHSSYYSACSLAGGGSTGGGSCCTASDCTTVKPQGEPCDFGGTSDVTYDTCADGATTYYYNIFIGPGGSMCL